MIGWAGDEDRYWLPDGSDGGRYRVSLTPVPGIDLAFEVSDRQGTVVQRVDDGGPGSGESRLVDIDATSYVGTPIITVSAGQDESSHLVYELKVEGVGVPGSP